MGDYKYTDEMWLLTEPYHKQGSRTLNSLIGLAGLVGMTSKGKEAGTGMI